VWANMTEEKRARVKEWHRSPEGRADHRRRALAAWAKEKAGPPPTHACIRCGKPYQSYRPKKGFCSMACQQASRRASGKDSETRQCVVCSAPFTVRDKYSPKRACSPKCTGVLKSKAATAQHAAHRVRQTPK
jgi:predicted nucleic acid-binding Zn ribbon protein